MLYANCTFSLITVRSLIEPRNTGVSKLWASSSTTDLLHAYDESTHFAFSRSLAHNHYRIAAASLGRLIEKQGAREGGERFFTSKDG